MIARIRALIARFRAWLVARRAPKGPFVVSGAGAVAEVDLVDLSTGLAVVHYHRGFTEVVYQGADYSDWIRAYNGAAMNAQAFRGELQGWKNGKLRMRREAL